MLELSHFNIDIGRVITQTCFFPVIFQSDQNVFEMTWKIKSFSSEGLKI